MPAKKKAAKKKSFADKVKAGKASESGAYVKRKGSNILNTERGPVLDPFAHAWDKGHEFISKVRSKTKASESREKDNARAKSLRDAEKSKKHGGNLSRAGKTTLEHYGGGRSATLAQRQDEQRDKTKLRNFNKERSAALSRKGKK